MIRSLIAAAAILPIAASPALASSELFNPNHNATTCFYRHQSEELWSKVRCKSARVDEDLLNLKPGQQAAFYVMQNGAKLPLRVEIYRGRRAVVTGPMSDPIYGEPVESTWTIDGDGDVRITTSTGFEFAWTPLPHHRFSPVRRRPIAPSGPAGKPGLDSNVPFRLY